ncbi:MAG: hypothetical protein R6X13_07925 [bacterium]
MADVTARIANWALKFNTERMKAILDERRPMMLERYSAVVVELWSMEVQVKQVLDEQSVQTILYVPYLNYGRELFRLSRQRGISGNSFALAAQVLLTKWAARSLDPAVLAAIRSQVFNIPAPV